MVSGVELVLISRCPVRRTLVRAQDSRPRDVQRALTHLQRLINAIHGRHRANHSRSSAPVACGFLVGLTDASSATPLAAVRINALKPVDDSGLPSPDWARKPADELSLPPGVSIIGFYAACDKAQLATLVGKHSAELRKILAPAARDRALLAAGPGGNRHPPSTRPRSPRVSLADAAPPADDTLDALDARVVGSRGAARPPAGYSHRAARRPLWEKAHAAATNAALAQHE